MLFFATVLQTPSMCAHARFSKHARAAASTHLNFVEDDGKGEPCFAESLAGSGVRNRVRVSVCALCGCER